MAEVSIAEQASQWMERRKRIGYRGEKLLIPQGYGGHFEEDDQEFYDAGVPPPPPPSRRGGGQQTGAQMLRGKAGGARPGQQAAPVMARPGYPMPVANGQPTVAPNRPAIRQPPVQPMRSAPAPVKSAPAPAGGAIQPFTRDIPMMVRLTEVPEMLDGFQEVGVAYAFDGKKKALCGEVNSVLTEFLGPESSWEIKYSEGSNMLQDSWEKFPEVGEALAASSPTNECFCIAALPSHGIWSIGVQDKGSIRFYCSHVGLALTLASLAMDEGEDTAAIEAMNTFGPLLQEYRRVKDEPMDGSAKKRRR